MQTLESYTVIRVGVPDAPYVIGVIRDGAQLITGRLDAAADIPVRIGTPVSAVSHDGDYTLYSVAGAGQ
ncbi:OB-fold domain-containing protein [Kribbella capetownensis]|uniref:OB-fold domain-containing protein n=1 Tax=Kribbella capetownensis TaxID=1572659 RepID=A0A4V2M4V8_9ACTN|nr:OB-fold domain-containing protein [Kribbella capetownensis]TCC37392.1 OB-fold domain-containing protein [Kribbella capetownensis]